VSDLSNVTLRYLGSEQKSRVVLLYLTLSSRLASLEIIDKYIVQEIIDKYIVFKRIIKEISQDDANNLGLFSKMGK